MATLAQTLGATTPVSVLLRKARRLGLSDLNSLIATAASRGCRHYAASATLFSNTPTREALADEELTILLMIGENPYDPSAIRCAAQLARSPLVNPERLAKLAIMEKTERVLAHVARSGVAHDAEGFRFWDKILDQLSATTARNEPDLPHWTRFVSMPGRQRTGMAPTRWLVPNT
jgi:hypothetical protein